MTPEPRRKSPRAPSISLNDALDRVMKVYDKERLDAVSVDAVANAMGYKSANNGAALSAIASLRYYGLIERPRDGYLAVCKAVERFRFALSGDARRTLLIQFLKNPPLYADLLAKFDSGLPPDADLKHELVERGFMVSGAGSALSSFKQSVSFARYFDKQEGAAGEPPAGFVAPSGIEEICSSLPLLGPLQNTLDAELELDRIPVRLPGGRRAWLLIPSPFYEADKLRLKAQIDLLLTEEELD